LPNREPRAAPAWALLYWQNMRAAIITGLVSFTLAGCGPGAGTYCQSGPKYGTQCYAQPDVVGPSGSRPEEERRKGEPPATPPNKVPW
jgi:hypothetical protein